MSESKTATKAKAAAPGPNQTETAELVPLALIRLDPGTQVRARIDEEVVGEYAQAMGKGAPFPEVTLVKETPYHFAIADGWHRVLAAKKLGRKHILARWTPGDRQTTLRIALRANAAHGLRRTNADKRRAVELALKAFPRLSSRQIADLCAVSHFMVDAVRGADVAENATSDGGSGGGDVVKFSTSHDEKSSEKDPSGKADVAENATSYADGGKGDVGNFPTSDGDGKGDVGKLPTSHDRKSSENAPGGGDVVKFTTSDGNGGKEDVGKLPTSQGANTEGKRLDKRGHLRPARQQKAPRLKKSATPEPSPEDDAAAFETWWANAHTGGSENDKSLASQAWTAACAYRRCEVDKPAKA